MGDPIKRIAGPGRIGKTISSKELTADKLLLGYRAKDLHRELDRLLARHDAQLRCERTSNGIKVTFAFRGTDAGLNVLTLRHPAPRVAYLPEADHLKDAPIEPAEWSPSGVAFLAFVATDPSTEEVEQGGAS